MNPLVVFPDRSVSLPMMLWGPVDLYAAMAAYGQVVVDDLARYDKRDKQKHRYDIIDVHGRRSLTVPVCKPSVNIANDAPAVPFTTWHNVAISNHGQWWHQHRLTLESAYGRTPFFEYYIDRLSLFFEENTSQRFPSVAALCIAANKAVCDILCLDNKILSASELCGEGFAKADMALFGNSIQYPYWQVRAAQMGFEPTLSILDLIFNLGTDAPLYLRRLIGNPEGA